MGHRAGRPSPPWACLFLLTASTGSALSLSNFQLLTSTRVPLSCLLAYNARIPGCSVDDFVLGGACSAECVRGLARIQHTVQVVCGDVEARAASVLGQALLGNLVGLLCPSASPEEAPRTTFITTSTTFVVTPTSSSPPQTSSTERPPSTTTTTASTQATTSTSTTAAQTEEEPDTTSSSGPPTSSELSQTTTSSAESTAPPATETSTSAPSPEPTLTLDNSSGGGSPFDIPISDARQGTRPWVKASCIALALGLVLLR